MNPACSATRKQITVLGINSRFGKAVSFLLKQSPIANRLVLYDECNTEVAHDLSAINTTCKVVVYNGEEQLRCAVKNSDLILISDKEDPGPNVDETIGKAAPDVIKYAEAISCSAPNAIVLVAASPVNSMLSLFSEVQVRNGTFDCDRVMGVTSVDTMRASTELARHMNLDPEKVHLPVIGGSSPDTRIPLFSQSRPAVTLCKADLRKMTRMIKMSECELFKLLNRGDALNKAYATVRLMDSVMSALRGQRNISEIVLSRTCLVPDVDYFSLPVILGPRGIAHRFSIPTLTERENILLEHAIKCIQVDKQKAVDIVCKRARSQQCRTPEKTKEYCDLLECDKKGIFVGALLDKLRIRKEACKPKLEYLLMCKNNDLVYPPDCEPCLSPKRIKFVEPDSIPNDGCCPVKLPCPPTPPKRGLTVIEPKRSKCKIVSSPCPYPPVVKLPKTCNICERGSPCEHYEGCKNLYGDTKCCGKTLSQSDKSILASKSEQPDTQPTPSPSRSAYMSSESNAMLAGVNDQLVVGQQANSFVLTPDELQYSPMSQSNTCELPQCTTANHSMPLATLDNTEVKSADTSPNVITNSQSVVSETHCPYGMSINLPASDYNQTRPVSERNSDKNISHFSQTVTNGSATESNLISHSKQADPIGLDRGTTHHSYSVPMKSPAHQNPKSAANQEILIQPGDTGSSSDTKNGPLSAIPLPRNIDQSIDQCLSKKCLVGINPGNESAPTPFENNQRIAATEPVTASTVRVTQSKTVEQYAIDSSKARETHPQVQNSLHDTSAAQHAVAESNSTAPRTLRTTNTDVSVQDTSKIRKTLCEYEKNSFVGSVQPAPTNSSTETFNYKGGLGIPSKQMERDPNYPFLSFNPWSAQREEQYYNELSATNDQLKNESYKEKVSTPVVVTTNPNEKQTCEIQKPADAEKMGHKKCVSKENKCGNDSSVLNSTGPEIGTVSNISYNSDVGTDKLKSYGPKLNEIEKEMKDLTIPETVPISCGAGDHVGSPENKLVKKEFPEDPGINALVSNMRMRENIRTSIEKVKKQNNKKSNTEKTKILGFGQIINALIPSTKFYKRTEGKTNKRTKPFRKLYVETHSNLQTIDPKAKKGSVMTLPIASPSSNKDCTMNRTKNNSSCPNTFDVHSEISKIAVIRTRVQEALKSIMYPPKYSQKPADRLAKQEKQVERILQEKLRRASKAIKYNVREVRKVDSAYEPVSQKLYAPKCPRRLIFGNRPDSRVITFNNVREFDVPKVKTEKVASAGERIPCSDVVDQTMNIVSKQGKSSEKSLTVREERISSNHLRTDHQYVENTNVTDSDKINSAVHEYPDVQDSDYWTHRPHSYAYQVPPPTSNQEYVQNQPVPITLKSTTAQPILNHEYLKNIIEQRTLREKGTEANFDQLESIIRERSKNVMTPGSLRLARVDDPKYGLTSPNRMRSNK